MTHSFAAEQWLPYPLALVFLFFSDPANLPPLMPGWQRTRIETMNLATPPDAPRETPRHAGAVAGAGTRMTLTFRAVPLLPFRIAWDARITEFAWNDHFCDVIDGRGPFSSWRHCHRLSAESRSPDANSPAQPGTLLRDEVEYALPFGPLGRVANAIAVRRQIAGMFQLRHQRTAELLPRFVAQLSGS